MRQCRVGHPEGRTPTRKTRGLSWSSAFRPSIRKRTCPNLWCRPQVPASPGVVLPRVWCPATLHYAGTGFVRRNKFDSRCSGYASASVCSISSRLRSFRRTERGGPGGIRSERSDKTGRAANRNTKGENPALSSATRSPKSEAWWARRDSNPRPKDYESSALTAELQARLERWDQK